MALLFVLWHMEPANWRGCWGQTETATLSGIIQDPRGAVVPGVEVTLTRIETGTVGTTTTNGAGIYVFTGLEPGHFRLLVRKEGFKEISIKEFELHVQDKLEQNFSLEIGSISERVTVEGNGLVINTTDATVATVIDRQFVENLPLNGRSFQTLLLLTPGVVLTTTDVSANAGQFSVNGQRANSNSFTVDGVSANGSAFLQGNPGPQSNGANPAFTALGTTQGMVAVDALQEFKILTSTFAPEFGRQPGGQVLLLTRSGTNLFHGTAFDYLRNTVFDANNWFNDASGLPKAPEHQNDFGGTLGGAVRKDKTFFFFSYEGLRLGQPQTAQRRVPSLRLRQEAAPAYAAILNSWPVPTGPEFMRNGTPTGAAPYVLSVSQPSNLDSYSIKVDQTFGPRVHLFGRFADASSDAGALYLNRLTRNKFDQRGVTIGTDVQFSTNINNELRVNYSVNTTLNDLSLSVRGGGKSFDTSVLFPQPLVAGPDNAAWFLSLPHANFQFLAGPNGNASQRQINVVDNTSYSLGAHQLKWGIDYRRLFPQLGAPPLSVFYEVGSESDLTAGNLTTGGNSFAATTSALTTHPIYTNFSAYGQDTWRVSNRIALTLGLRWELNPAPSERDGLYPPSNVIGISNPATATLGPLGRPYKTTYDDFAPRVGVAYQPRKTPGRELVVRGGFGVFYDLNSENFATQLGLSDQSQNFTNLTFPVPNNVLPAPPIPIALTPPLNVHAIDPNLQLPYTLQWNVSVEQAFGGGQSLIASYVASSGHRLLRADQLFNVSSEFRALSLTRNASSSNYQSLQVQFNRKLSRGLQALASYTYSHSIDDASNGVVALSGSLTGSPFLNPSIDRGNSDFDLRHAFRAALTYNIPTWHANFLSRAILGGWSAESVLIAQTGMPVDLIGGDYFPAGQFIQLRPNIVSGQALYLYGAQCTAANGGVACPGGMGFNPNAFTPVPTDTNGNPTQVQGTLGRNMMRGFGGWQADFALHRQFNFTERVNLQFRSEFFNLFNHPNFAGIDNFVPDGPGSFGLSQSTLNNSLGGLNALYQIGGPRSVQLALKLSF